MHDLAADHPGAPRRRLLALPLGAGTKKLDPLGAGTKKLDPLGAGAKKLDPLAASLPSMAFYTDGHRYKIGR